MLAHGTKEWKLWIWHRRLGRTLLGYLEHLFKIDFACETCILAKSHRHSYPSLNNLAFLLVNLSH